jgi:hypothetical protein
MRHSGEKDDHLSTIFRPSFDHLSFWEVELFASSIRCSFFLLLPCAAAADWPLCKDAVVASTPSWTYPLPRGLVYPCGSVILDIFCSNTLTCQTSIRIVERE